MVIRTSEQAFEEVIERALLAGGPDAPPGPVPTMQDTRAPYEIGRIQYISGGYHKRSSQDYDPEQCLIPPDVFDFIRATQPKMWDKFKKNHGDNLAEAKQRLRQRLASEIKTRGTLDVLRRGIRLDGCRFELAYFRPANGLNQETQRLYRANHFTVPTGICSKPSPTILTTRRLAEFYFYNTDEVDRFTAIYLGQLGPNVALPQLHAMLDPVVERYREATVDEQADFRKILTDYVRLYAFLAQVAPFSDAHLEKLYLFGRLLRRKLPGSPDTLPLEVQQQIELESLRIAQTSSGDIGLERGQTQLTPMRPKEGQTQIAAHVDALSAIILDLNERYGFTDFSDEEVFTVQRIETKADTSAALKASAHVNTPDNFRLSFDNFIKERFQELLEDNFKLYKKITDDPDFAKSLLDALFERYLKRLGSNGEALNGV